MRHLPTYIILSVLFLLSACKDKPEDTSKARPVYETKTVTLSDITLNTSYPATLQGMERVEIRPQISGLLTKIWVQDGESVKKGQMLFSIDPIPYQAALDEAVANLKLAEAKRKTAQVDLDSKCQLYSQKVISETEKTRAEQAYAEAEAQVEQAKAKKVQAQNQLSYTRITSPVDGVISMIPYNIGALVSSNISEPLVTVSSDRLMKAYFSISEREFASLLMQYGSADSFIKAMPPVQLHLSNGEPYDREGHIDAVSGIAETGSISMRALFPNDNGLLKSGGSATLILPTTQDSVVVIPQTATFELQNKTFTYRVLEGKAQSTPIEVLPIDDGRQYVVTQGLAPGDVIVARGAGLIKEGEQILP